jgi:hypothetical protein
MNIVRGSAWAFVLIMAVCLVPAIRAGNQVMGELQFEGKSKVEKTSGVWIDGGYVGYLKELKGSKRVLLLPGEHTITVRQNGYQDFSEQVTIRPGEKKVVHVAMERAPMGTLPKINSTVKLTVFPTRAAVFVDGQFVGHVGEFEGLGRGMVVAPGPHKIRIVLPGYQAFETEISPLPDQKVEVKTNLIKANASEKDRMLTPGSLEPAPPPPPPGSPQM